MGDIAEIHRLSELGIPPIISRDVLAVMLGINPGLLWSFEQRPMRYYRHFTIKKGDGLRHIYAPKVALKAIQKWLSVHFSRRYTPADHVFGFVPGRSHLDAASTHCGARWVFSSDIRNFFPSTPVAFVTSALRELGYDIECSNFLSKFFCLFNGLAQGAPSSPVLSNIAFRTVDANLSDIAFRHGARLSRYADDIVFSGTGDFPAAIVSEITDLFANLPWDLAPEKTEIAIAPRRLKVHGLLVHGETIRLTKGYRNRIRAYTHLLENGLIAEHDIKRVAGHVRYARQVSEFYSLD